jgi:hypothetical protein
LIGVPISLIAQEVTVYTYKQVPNAHLGELLERENKYWSKVARKAIDNGKLTFWAVLVKQGAHDAPNSSNILYVNTFKDINNTADIWNAQALFPDVPMEDMDTWKPEFGHVMHQLYIQGYAWQQASHAVPDNDFKYIQMVYHKTDQPNDFLDVEKDHWGPFIKKMMDEKITPQVGWGNARVLSPSGTNLPFNSISYDLFPSMGAALVPEIKEGFTLPEESNEAFSKITHSDRNIVLYQIFAVESTEESNQE